MTKANITGPWPPCRGCKRPAHPHYAKKYHGYCLDCANCGVDERDERIAELEAALKKAQLTIWKLKERK